MPGYRPRQNASWRHAQRSGRRRQRPEPRRTSRSSRRPCRRWRREHDDQGRLNSAAGTTFWSTSTPTRPASAGPRLPRGPDLPRLDQRDDRRGRATRPSPRPPLVGRAGRESQPRPPTRTATPRSSPSGSYLSLQPRPPVPGGGAGVALTRFNFLPGADGERRRRGASGVVVNGYGADHHENPKRPFSREAERHHACPTRMGRRGPPNGWVADFLDVPGGQLFFLRHDARPQPDHRRVGGGNYCPRRSRWPRWRSSCCGPGSASASPGALHRAGFPRRALRLPLRCLDRGARRAGGHRRLRRRQLLSHQPGQPPPDGVFLLKALKARLRPAPCTVATFTDVPCSNSSHPGSRSWSPGRSPPAAAVATTAPARARTAARSPRS